MALTGIMTARRVFPGLQKSKCMQNTLVEAASVRTPVRERTILQRSPRPFSILRGCFAAGKIKEEERAMKEQKEER